jgi:hypothetical protein
MPIRRFLLLPALIYMPCERLNLLFVLVTAPRQRPQRRLTLALQLLAARQLGG